MIIFYLLIHVKHINIIPTGKFFHDIFQSTLRKTKRPMPPSHLFIHIHRPYPYFIIFQNSLLSRSQSVHPPFFLYLHSPFN